MDIDRILRRCRSALSAGDLPARSDEDINFFESADVVGERIMLDTCAIIDQLQDRLPTAVEQRILARSVIHSPVVLGELSFLIGRLDHSNKDTKKAVQMIADLLRSIPEHRVSTLSHEDLVLGNILAGTMSRILNYPKEAQRKARNDGVLAAHASRLGCLLVTRNIVDFDRLSQLDPKLRVAFYRL